MADLFCLYNGMKKHIHHIVPKHAGGTDDPSNLVELSVEEHAAAHLALYEKYGRWQDKVAADLLSMGETNEAWQAWSEARRKRNEGKRRGEKRSEETKRKMREAWKRREVKGVPHTEEAKKKIGEASRNRSVETRKKLSEAACEQWQRQKS